MKNILLHGLGQNSKLVIVEDSGYEVNKDAPDELARILWEFWDR